MPWWDAPSGPGPSWLEVDVEASEPKQSRIITRDALLSLYLPAMILALGLVNWICTLSPQRIVLGGGVMRRQELFPLIRSKVVTLLNAYLEPPEIVPPELGSRAGVLGAIALAERVS